MVELLDGFVGSSCVIKAKNNDLISMGVLHRIGKNFIDVGSSRNELPGIPYNLIIKLEIYNTQLGFKVLIGRVYLSSPKLVRIVELNEATNDERREYFRISTRDDGIIYNCIRGNETLDMGEGSEDQASGGPAAQDTVDLRERHVRRKRGIWFRGNPGTSVWSGTGGWRFTPSC